MEKKNFSNEDIRATELLAINLIAQGDRFSLGRLLKLFENGAPFTLATFCALHRTGHLVLLPQIFSACEYCDADEILKKILEEKIYTQEELDEMLIQNNSSHLSSPKGLIAHEKWEVLLDNKEYHQYAQEAEKNPKLWKMFDEKASVNALAKYNRIDELEKREAYERIIECKGGANRLFELKKLDILLDYTFLLSDEQCKIMIEEFKLQATGKAQITKKINAAYLVKLGYQQILVDEEKWRSLFKEKQYQFINWDKWYENADKDEDKSTLKYTKENILKYAKEHNKEFFKSHKKNRLLFYWRRLNSYLGESHFSTFLTFLAIFFNCFFRAMLSIGSSQNHDEILRGLNAGNGIALLLILLISTCFCDTKEYLKYFSPILIIWLISYLSLFL
ncbi:MAG: hypothetical protein R3Y43_03950 [Alphaproteobacteria bacterium]